MSAHEGEYVPVPGRNMTPALSQELTSDLDAENPGAGPVLLHQWTPENSILCVAASANKKLVFCGTQDAQILVFDIESYLLKFAIKCTGETTFSVLCLTLSEHEDYLFSAGSDSLVRVWDVSGLSNTLSTNEVSCTHIVYSLVDIGDIFTVSWSPQFSTLFIGAQNASILWCELPLGDNSTSQDLDRLPHLRFDRFFDLKGPGGTINSLQSKQQLLRTQTTSKVGPQLVEIPTGHNIRFAHNSYVYCTEILVSLRDLFAFPEVLISCGGDGVVNIWGFSGPGKTLTKLASLDNDESILSMSLDNFTLYVGLSDSSINVWDLLTFQLVRSFHFVDKDNPTSTYDEVLSLGLFNGCIFKASSVGGLMKFTLKSFKSKLLSVHEEKGNNSTNHQNLHFTHYVSSEDERYNSFFGKSNNSVLAVKIFCTGLQTLLVSAGLRSLCLWDVSEVGLPYPHMAKSHRRSLLELLQISNEDLLKSLGQLISFKTISKLPSLYLDDSRHCAQFLSKLLISLGASQTKLLPVANGNPIIYSKFEKNSPAETSRRVLWYGHYDVVEANGPWETDPFSLVAKNGNLYARGVSDNKGPVLAAIYAVAELLSKGELSCDITFIFEGEEECGSIGFQNVINEYKPLIGEIDWVMLSNSYWLDDETPCLNYGLRGVINASVTISSDKPDRHSGVDGGVSSELAMDLIHILGELVDKKTDKINLPGFYDDVLPLTQTELEIYKRIETAAVNKKFYNQDLRSLMAKWREPSLTVHKIQVSGPNNNTVIPQTVKASISMRIVPNQDIEKVKKSLIDFLTKQFDELHSENKLTVNIFHEAEPWLGDPTNLVYQILYEKIKSNWGPGTPDPLFVREGGTIPSIRFLEKCFNAPAAQIPCGQASDNAHLMNEKLRIINLYKLRDIITDTLRELGKSTQS